MFGLFKSPPFTDPALGLLQRTRGLWRGTIVLAGRSVPLALAGTRAAPDPDALAIAKRLPVTWAGGRDAVGCALVAHLEPYRQAAVGENDVPAIAQPADVWRFVDVLSGSVTPIGGALLAEIALTASWDEEHLLGARFEGDVLIELNASIVPP